jgi:hypothetical protein
MGIKKIDRRRFLSSSASASALALPVVRILAQTASSAASLQLHEDRPGPLIPANFIGLSYETEQLSDPSFFSASNTGLVEQFRALAPHGVLRLGGNTSDIGWWKPTPTSTAPPINIHGNGNGEPTAALAYPITPDAITNLRGFLDATGWTCLFGINLGTNTPERAAEQAAFVHKTLRSTQQGGKLEYFQIGNEPDLFGRHLRDPKTWNADRYFDEWLAMANAIRARVPYARFGLPDTGGAPDWYAAVVNRLLTLHADGCPCAQSPAAACSCTYGPSTPKDARPHIAALTHHYYFGGPPSNPKVNIERLLQPDPRVLTLANDIQAAAARLTANSPLPVPYRMSEGNTCYRGGKPGVSDVFAAALWAADYCLLLASLGYCGVNLHGGSAKQVANSLGGTLPGDALITNHNEQHPRPFYTPIAQSGSSYVAEPVFHGMRFAQNFVGAMMIPLTFNPGTVDATAYAAKLPTGQTIVALINKDASKPLPVDLPSFSLGHIMTAKSLTSMTVEDLQPNNNREASSVPPATAMLLYSSRG